MGTRYTCKIHGIEKFLWLDEYTWFVETNKWISHYLFNV
jgi:hypothetical protein